MFYKRNDFFRWQKREKKRKKEKKKQKKTIRKGRRRGWSQPVIIILNIV